MFYDIFSGVQYDFVFSSVTNQRITLDLVAACWSPVPPCVCNVLFVCLNLNELDSVGLGADRNERLSLVSHPQFHLHTWPIRSSSWSHGADCETLMFGNLNLPEPVEVM